MPKVNWFIKIFFLTIAIVGIAWAGPLRDRIEVDFSHNVDVGPKVLAPGHYVFEQIGTQPLFKVSGPSGENITLTAQAIHTVYGTSSTATAGEVPNQTKVILEQVGDTYYLDKIWIAGQNRGWGFTMADRAQNQSSSKTPEEVTASYRPITSTSEAISSSPTGGNQASTNSNMGYAENNTDVGGRPVNSLTGCLQTGQTSGTFMLQTDVNAPTTMVVPTANLSNEMGKQIGRRVRLVGMWTAPGASQASGYSNQSMSDQNQSTSDKQESMSKTEGMSRHAQAGTTSSVGQSGSSANGSGEQREFRVDRIDVIADSCAAM